MDGVNNDMTYDLEAAFNNKQFILYYQPQIDINAMKICGVEALLRLKSNKFGIVPPKYFIDTLEETGEINEVGRLVLKGACDELSTLEGLGYSNLCMSVNISGKQLKDKSFPGFVKNLINSKKVDVKFLCFELTENILVSPTKPVIQSFNEIKDLGIKMYIDDYGTKNASLNYLKQFSFDGIKIDRSFVYKMTDSKKEFIITKNIIDLAHDLGIDSIAEGVEQKEQFKCLKNTNCNKIQGFFFGRPMDSKHLFKFLGKFKEKGMI